MVRDRSTYLITNDVKLGMTNIDCLCDRVNPTVVKFRVVEGHDGLYARPHIVFWVDAKAPVCGSGCNVLVHEA